MTWLAYNGLKKTLPHIIMIRKSFHEWKENKKGFVIKLYKKIMRWVIKLSYFSISLATLNYVFLIDLDLAITKLLVRFFVQSFLTFYDLSTKYFSTHKNEWNFQELFFEILDPLMYPILYHKYQQKTRLRWLIISYSLIFKRLNILNEKECCKINKIKSRL